MSQAPRIWISNDNPKQGEVVRVRAQIRHRMESGMRVGDDGDLIPRNIVSRFEARLGDDLLFVWEPETAITQHPYLEFTFVARKTEELSMVWTDDEGEVVTGSQSITVSG